MLFHSPDYVLFLILAVLGWWGLARRRLLRLGLLFALSCIFYMAWRPEYIALILGSTLLDYVAGHQIHRATAKSRPRRLWLAASLCGNLGLLFTFKYYNFFARELAEGLRSLGLAVDLPLLEMALPVGISFYTFQTLSYTIDIYRGQLKPSASFLEFACFVTYFPQLVAGPIVRATELLPQLRRPARLLSEKVSGGLFLILTGLVKKVALADYLAVNLVDRVYDQPELYTASETVVALYAFTMQLYLDFSGYTDVARGSAMLMGFELPANFDRPYQARSPAEFWRNWHMTLSRWLRDYLYFPLGGSRVGPVRAYLNLGLTMFLVGIWHGWWKNFEVFFWYASMQTVAMVGHRLLHRGRRYQEHAALGFAVIGAASTALFSFQPWSQATGATTAFFFVALPALALLGHRFLRRKSSLEPRAAVAFALIGAIGPGVFLSDPWWREHGATLFVYGALPGALVVAVFLLRRLLRRPSRTEPAPRAQVFFWFANLQFVVFSRVLFRSDSMENAEAVLAQLGEIGPVLDSLHRCVDPGAVAEEVNRFQACTSTPQLGIALWLVLLGSYAAHFTPRRLFASFETYFVRLPAPAQGLLIALVLALLSLVATAEEVPYIYFQF